MTVGRRVVDADSRLTVDDAKEYRSPGIGVAMVENVEDQLYLYTSGTLPEYYGRLGWTEKERLPYLGKPRVIMYRDL